MIRQYIKILVDIKSYLMCVIPTLEQVSIVTKRIQNYLNPHLEKKKLKTTKKKKTGKKILKPVKKL